MDESRKQEQTSGGELDEGRKTRNTNERRGVGLRVGKSRKIRNDKELDREKGRRWVRDIWQMDGEEVDASISTCITNGMIYTSWVSYLLSEAGGDWAGEYCGGGVHGTRTTSTMSSSLPS